ncbi:MAG: tetratricopeptide repeat protein [Flavobacteriales bacterium]|nr:tetratricopeptide repeat protein [Flavobacteriales bacterium]
MIPTWILARPLVLRTEEADRSRLWALIITGVYVVASLIYGFLSDAPWDDDCVARYFHAREVFSHPEYFFSLWDRPLFMVLFAPTALLGRSVMMVQMILISAGSGWLLYRTVHKLGARAPHWILPLFFFQAFFFTISRNFLTEPLAVAVICAGMYALVNQRYLLFALLGGLLPLARLELAVILPIWGLVLLQARQWKGLALMAAPVLLLMVLGYFVKNTDSLLWLVDETLGKEGKNRYGYRDVWHYFHRFAYVIGPVIFFFLTIGVLERLAQLRIDLFVLFQGAAILFLYVIFSWKLDMGNSAGFLRNLIPLTPFVAWLAWDGLLAWQGLVAREGPAASEEPDAATGLNRDERKRLKKVQDRKEKRKNRAPRIGLRLARVHVFAAIAVLVLYFYFDKKLESHHKISTVTDHIPPIIGAALFVVGLIIWFLGRRHEVHRAVLIGSAALVGVASMAFTMLSEQPNAHMNPERKAITTVSTLYKDSYLREWPLYVNHAWFFWPQDLGYPDHAKYRVLNKAALDTAEVHSVVFWENHYSQRLQGNVQIADLYKRKDMVELSHVMGSDHRLTIGLFQKVDTTAGDAGVLRERFMKAHPDNMGAYYAQNLEHARNKLHAEALVDAQRMVALDSTYVEGVLAEGQAFFDLNRFPEAQQSFERVLRMDTTLHTMEYSIALSQFRQNKFPDAVRSVQHYLKGAKKSKEAYEFLGAGYYHLQKYDSAATAFGEYIKIDGRSAVGWLNRASVRMQMGQVDPAIADLNEVLKREPTNGAALLNKAVLLIRKGQKDQGCPILQQLAAAGNMAAIQQLVLCQ